MTNQDLALAVLAVIERRNAVSRKGRSGSSSAVAVSGDDYATRQRKEALASVVEIPEALRRNLRLSRSRMERQLALDDIANYIEACHRRSKVMDFGDASSYTQDRDHFDDVSVEDLEDDGLARPSGLIYDRIGTATGEDPTWLTLLGGIPSDAVSLEYERPGHDDSVRGLRQRRRAVAAALRLLRDRTDGEQSRLPD